MPDIPLDSFEGLSPTELVGLLRRALSELEQERAEKAELKCAFLEQRREIEQLKDEVRRLKKLPPRPPIKPSGMEKATQPSGVAAAAKTPPRRRGPGVSKLKIDREMRLAASAPEGSRRKGFEDIIVQDVQFGPLITLYRRERWETPQGRTIVAGLPPGVRRLWAAFASSGADAAFSGSNDLRADRDASERQRRFDLEATGRAIVDRQAGDVSDRRQRCV